MREVLTLEAYRDEVLSLVTPMADVEDVPLAQAPGRVLAAPVLSRTDVPTFRNSAMDGFAVRHADLSPGCELTVVADLPAGTASDPALGPGECARIMTGAPVPTAADTIVQVEHTSPAPQPSIRVDVVPEQGKHVRQAGEDVAAGQVILPPGATLDARALAATAAAGVASVSCRRRPIVGVIATGDELVSPGGELGRGQIYESNATFLGAAVARDGGMAMVSPPVPDREDALRATLDVMAERADLIVLSGGVSVGDYDVVRLTLESADAAFRHVRMQPGKPQGWARWRVGERVVPVVALPGNPLSTAISYEMFVRPALGRLLGRPDPGPWTPAVALEGWRSPAGRRQLVPVTTQVDAEGRVGVRPAHRRGSASHMVTSLVTADALAMVDDDVTDVAPGDIVLTRRLA